MRDYLAETFQEFFNLCLNIIIQVELNYSMDIILFIVMVDLNVGPIFDEFDFLTAVFHYCEPKVLLIVVQSLIIKHEFERLVYLEIVFLQTLKSHIELFPFASY